MGNLTSTEISEIVATLETLEKCGVTRDDLKFLRRYSNFAAVAADWIKSGRRNYRAATESSNEDLALRSVEFFRNDDEILTHIAMHMWTVITVRLRAVELMVGRNALYKTARDSPEFRVAHAAMLRLTSINDLGMLGEYGYVWSRSEGRVTLNSRKSELSISSG